MAKNSTARKLYAPVLAPPDATNQPPVLNSLFDLSARPGTAVSFQATAVSPDGEALTFSLVSGPPGAAVSPDGQFTWTPDWSQLGAWTVVVRVTDSSGLSDTNSCTISVDNQPPVLNPLFDLTGHPGTPVTFLATASDPDGDMLTFSLVSGPPGAALTPSGQFTWTPTWSQLGAQTITVAVTDAGGLSDTQTCTISVNNQAPMLNPLSDLTAHPGRAATFQATAGDPDGDPLTFSLVNPPPGASISPSGQFSWTPTWSQLGAQTITVRVTDPGGLSDSQSCTITVGNQPPVMNSIADQQVQASTALTLQATASDPDSDPLRFSMDSGPPGAAVSPSGQFTWTPTPGQVGAWTVVLRVSDPGGLASVRSFTVTVD
jgi:hypothetical protein